MSRLDDKGFNRTRLDERIAMLEEAMRTIFGENINLAPDSIDGQTLGIFAEAISNLDQLAEDVYHSLNPQSASRLALSRLVQLNGIRRIAGRYSIVKLTATGQEGTKIPAGSLVSNPITKERFETLTEAVIPVSGDVEIAARSVLMGEIYATAGSIVKIDTPVYGWHQVTNHADAIPGCAEETDEDLRIRRRQSTATPAQSVLDGIHGTIFDIREVRRAAVFENDQDTPDEKGLPPHSIYCLADGGNAEEIARAIWIRKTAGTTTAGAESVVIGDSQGNPHLIRFSRPTEISLWLDLSISPRSGYPTDAPERVASALLEWSTGIGIGEEVVFSRLFEPINSIPGFAVTSLAIGTNPTNKGHGNIVVPFDGIARFDSTRITVMVDTP